MQAVARQLVGLHAARAAVLAAAAAAVALAAHALSAGCLDARGATAAVLLCAPAAWAVTAEQRSATVLLGWLSGTQLAVHLVLTALCGDALLTASLPAVFWHAAAVLLTGVLLHAGDASLWSAQRVRRATGHVLRLLVLPAPVVAARPGAQGVVRRRPVVRPVDWRGPTPARRGPPEAVHASC